MTALAPTSIAMNGSLAASQPASQSSSPASPTASFAPQQGMMFSVNTSKSPSPSSGAPGGYVVHGGTSGHTHLRTNSRPESPAQQFQGMTSSTSSAGSFGDFPPGFHSYGDFVKSWNDAHVGRWLADAKCRALAPVFAANDIRGSVLLDLDQATLREMGITSVGDRIKVINALKALRQKCSSRPAARPPPSSFPPPPPSSSSYHSTHRDFTPLRQQHIPHYLANSNNGSRSPGFSSGGAAEFPRTAPPAAPLPSAPTPEQQNASQSSRQHRGRPAPLQLRSTTQADLPKLIRDPQPPPDSARSTTPLRPLPVRSDSANQSGHHSQSSSGGGSASSGPSSRLPPVPPPPRSQPPLPPTQSQGPPPHPSSRVHALASQQQSSSGRRTPTQLNDQHQHLQLHVQTSQTALNSQNQLLTPISNTSSLTTPTASSSGSSWKGSDREYGLPSGPRSGAGGLQTPNTSASLSRAASPNTLGRSPQGIRQHTKTSSLSGVSPAPPAKDRSNRPNTAGSSHPYANSSAALQPPITNANNLSPIAETSGSQLGSASASSAYHVGRGPFNSGHQQNQLYPFPTQQSSQQQRPTTPSHGNALSLDDLRRRLVKFYLADDGHSVTLNTADCQDGIDVLERVLRKFGKIGGNSKEDEPYDQDISEDGGLIIDGWGVFLDWGGDDGPGKPLREGELLSVCSAGPDHPVRKHGLTVRRVGKSKRSKALQQIFGEQPPAPMVAGSTSNSSAATATISNTREREPASPKLMFATNPHLSGDETDEDDSSPISHSAASPSPYGPSGFAKTVQERELRNMKRASSISVLSGLGVRDPERVLESSTNSSSANSSTTQLSKEQTNTAAKSPSASTFAGKMRAFLGQRPPSELIATHLPAYFPYTQPKVLRRTLRQSVRLSSMVGVGKRESTLSIVGQGIGEQLPSRFSSSTIGSHVGQRTSMSPSRASSISLPPPPVPEKSPPKTGGPDTVDEPPRLSLSTSDGQTSELDHDSVEAERTEDENETESAESVSSGPKTHLLPPVNFPSESFADSFNSVTSGVSASQSAQSAVGGRSGPSPSISRTTSNASRRFSYMAELRARRDRSDTASMLTVDEITAEVENRRKSTAVSSLRSSESNEEVIGEDVEVTEEPDTYLDTTEDLVAAADEEDEDDDEDDEDTLDDGGYDVVDESTLADTDEDVEPVKATGGKRGIKWIRGALIGSGSFGQVYLGMDAMNGLLMAVKQVPLPSGTGPNEERKRVNLRALEREIDLLRDLQHENIVQYLDSSSDDQYLNIFLEYVPGGSVSALLRNYGAFEETLCRHFVRQILQGLSYLHDRDIIHRDIKGANILVDNKGGIKISDFGISKKVEEIPSPLLVPQALAKGGRNRESFKGTVFWMAPEAVQQKSYTRKADIWSVGCLVVEMLTGQRPWPNLTEFQAIFKVGMNAKPEIPADISAEAEDFLNKTFEFNTELRPSAKELLQHPWIVKAGQAAGGNSMKPSSGKTKGAKTM
ncbi:Pkinase-domain-containing protein [Schizopora paradoxa]|uniref:mitogen-activated protein kinase kinase kinase n=1 Tax=Schizopora paradoxa TaxID=27342 RepID=A0A0H2RVS7_9AGAM|nr:Pkinase-domain-containing protein [Schizopora paradoxa]